LSKTDANEMYDAVQRVASRSLYFTTKELPTKVRKLQYNKRKKWTLQKGAQCRTNKSVHL